MPAIRHLAPWNHILPREYSRAQLDAGNYRKPKITFQGLPVSIENPRGSIRSGRSRAGHEWQIGMQHHYGYIRGTLGRDGDHFDVYVGPLATATHAYIVNQMAPPTFTRPDEQKAMLGFPTLEAAREAYLAHYDDPRFLGSIVAMPMDEFKAKVRATRAGGPKMLKGFVQGYERRGPGGRPVFVRPYSTRVTPDQPGLELFSYVPPPPKPEGRITVTQDLEDALPRAAVLAGDLSNRLLPGYNVHFYAIHDRTQSSGHVVAPGMTLSYGGEDQVPLTPKTGPHFAIMVNTSTADGETRSTDEMLHTILHEVGHAVQCARYADASIVERDAIRAQWRRENRIPSATIAEGPPQVLGRDTADAGMMRRFISSGVPDRLLRDPAVVEPNLRARSPYYRQFEEWFAESFARWVEESNVPDTPIMQFFERARGALMAAWRRGLELLGITDPRQTPDGPFQRFIERVWRAGGETVAKAILFLKAAIPGGAAQDLFGEKVQVEGHARGGTWVAPYQAQRKKKPEEPRGIGRYSHAMPAGILPGWYAVNDRGEQMRHPTGEAVRMRDQAAVNRWGAEHNRKHFVAQPALRP